MSIVVARLLSIVALGSPAPASVPHFSPCHVAGVDEALRCANYTVPENRTTRRGRQLVLKIVVVPASDPSGSKEPIFFFSGGPGEAATEGAADFAGSWERKRHDVVLVDVRGSAQKDGLDCDFGGSDAHPQGYLEPMFAEGTEYRSCRKQLEKRADLTRYTTPMAADDIDEIRAAMRYDKINIEAGSYGTRLALVYMRYHGEHVRSALLGGIVAFENRNPLYHAAAAQQAFEHLTDECAAEAACHAAFPETRADLAAILERLRHAPVPVTVDDPVTHKPISLSLSASAFADGLRVMLYAASQGRKVPLLLHRARGGDFQPFAQAAFASSRGMKRGIRAGLLLSVTCSEDVARIKSDEIEHETARTFIGDARVRGQIAACSVWPRAMLPHGYFDHFQSKVPLVMFSGRLDPVTPPQWGELVKTSFSDSIHVIVPGGHVEMDDCVGSIGEQLFEKGSTRELDIGCVANLRNPPFVLR